MTCTSNIERGLKKVDGVEKANVNLAVIGWMHPVLAGIALASSTTTVMSNANRLRRVHIRFSYQEGTPERTRQREVVPSRVTASV